MFYRPGLYHVMRATVVAQIVENAQLMTQMKFAP